MEMCFTLSERERDALIDDTLKEVSRLHGTTSNYHPGLLLSLPWFLFFLEVKYYGNLHEKGIFVSQSSFAPIAIYSSLHCHSSSQQREEGYDSKWRIEADILPRTRDSVVM